MFVPVYGFLIVLLVSFPNLIGWAEGIWEEKLRNFESLRKIYEKIEEIKSDY